MFTFATSLRSQARQLDKAIPMDARRGGLVGVKLASMWPGRASALVIVSAPVKRPTFGQRLASRMMALRFILSGGSAGTRR